MKKPVIRDLQRRHAALQKRLQMEDVKVFKSKYEGYIGDVFISLTYNAKHAIIKARAPGRIMVLQYCKNFTVDNLESNIKLTAWKASRASYNKPPKNKQVSLALEFFMNQCAKHIRPEVALRGAIERGIPHIECWDVKRVEGVYEMVRA